MTEPVLTHDQQREASMIEALKGAGIGRSFAVRTFDTLGPKGIEFRDWMIENRTRFGGGAGVDFRGGSVATSDWFNLFGRSLLVLEHRVRLVPLMTLARAVRTADGFDEMFGVGCLLIRGFERAHETPLTFGERSDVEDFIMTRMDDNRSTSVSRQSPTLGGWWSTDVEDALSMRNYTQVVAK